MKLKTISAIFNRNKRLIIFTNPDNGEQWICNGYAAYTLRGLPTLTPFTVLKIFDIPEDKHCKWHCDELDLPTSVSFEDAIKHETDIIPLRTNIELFGVNHWCFVDGERIYTFDESFIKPLFGGSDYLTYHKRETENGGFVLACKIGMELKAVIMPRPLYTNPDFMDEIKMIAALHEKMCDERNEIINSAQEVYGTQYTDESTPETDPDTREILEGQTDLYEKEGAENE